MASKKQRVEEPEIKPVRIDWHYPETLVGRYANHLIIQIGEHECNLSFFEMVPPLLIGTSEEKFEKFKQLTSVRAECVSRVVVSVDRLPIMIKAMQDVYAERFEKAESTEQTSPKK